MAQDDREILQRFVDGLFADRRAVTRLETVVRAEAMDLPSELLEIIDLLPPGTHRRSELCDQLNSALKGHGWTRAFGTVD